MGGDDLRLLPVSLEDIGNAFLVTGPRRSGRSTALHFATNRLLENGQKIVLVLPRKSPLMELANNPGVLGVLGMDAGPNDLSELLKEDPENTVIVVDDFDTLTNDHNINPRIEEHIKTCRDHHGGVLVACGIDEIGGMYRGVHGACASNINGKAVAHGYSGIRGGERKERHSRKVHSRKGDQPSICLLYTSPSPRD